MDDFFHFLGSLAWGVILVCIAVICVAMTVGLVRSLF